MTSASLPELTSELVVLVGFILAAMALAILRFNKRLDQAGLFQRPSGRYAPCLSHKQKRSRDFSLLLRFYPNHQTRGILVSDCLFASGYRNCSLGLVSR